MNNNDGIIFPYIDEFNAFLQWWSWPDVSLFESTESLISDVIFGDLKSIFGVHEMVLLSS